MIRPTARLTLAVVIACCVSAQTTPPLAFEVASIKPSPNSDEGRTPWRYKETPGGIDYGFASAESLILKAFDLKSYQLVMPRGYQAKEWDIVAKAPANSRIQDFPLMLRSLLADRFQLAFHRETRERPVYELVVAKGGSKLKEVPPPGGGLGGYRTAEGMIHSSGKIPLSLLAKVLTAEVRMPVIDKTGIQGIFEIDFEYAPLATNAPADGGSTAGFPGPTVFSALERTLGLRLEPRKDAVEILVVDHLAETPTEN